METEIVSVDPAKKKVKDRMGNEWSYSKLLIATGGLPRKLPIPGGEMDEICYYRTLNDYLRVRAQAQKGRTAVIIGGGFIGSEIAAALHSNGILVTMIFPEEYLCKRIFPKSLGTAIEEQFLNQGIRILNQDQPASIMRRGNRFITRTKKDAETESDLLIAGIGIAPETALARTANLKTGDGITVNEMLQTSDPHIYAAEITLSFPALLWKKSCGWNTGTTR